MQLLLVSVALPRDLLNLAQCQVDTGKRNRLILDGCILAIHRYLTGDYFTGADL